jgi:hypothetical protein
VTKDLGCPDFFFSLHTHTLCKYAMSEPTLSFIMFSHMLTQIAAPSILDQEVVVKSRVANKNPCRAMAANAPVTPENLPSAPAAPVPTTPPELLRRWRVAYGGGKNCTWCGRPKVTDDPDKEIRDMAEQIVDLEEELEKVREKAKKKMRKYKTEFKIALKAARRLEYRHFKKVRDERERRLEQRIRLLEIQNDKLDAMVTNLKSEQFSPWGSEESGSSSQLAAFDELSEISD